MMGEFAKAQSAIGGYTVISTGSAAEHQAAQSAATLRAPFDAMRAATGIDLAALVQSGLEGERTGEAIARGMRADARTGERPAGDAGPGPISE